jgi:hypothetical protein
MAQSAAANISAAKMVAVTVMAIVKSDMLIATSFCCCLLNRFNGSWFQRSSLSSFSRETGKNVCRAPRSPSLIQKSQLRRLWDEDVATMAESVKDFDRLTFHARGTASPPRCCATARTKTASELGGWDDIGLLMKTYAHAIRDARQTDEIFYT